MSSTARESMINDINDLPNSLRDRRRINDLPETNDRPTKRNAGWEPKWMQGLRSVVYLVNEALPGLTEEWLLKHLQIEIGMAVQTGWLQAGDSTTPHRAAKWAIHNALKVKPRNLPGYFRACFRDFLASEGPEAQQAVAAQEPEMEEEEAIVAPAPAAQAPAEPEPVEIVRAVALSQQVTADQILADREHLDLIVKKVEVEHVLIHGAEKEAYFRYRNIPIPKQSSSTPLTVPTGRSNPAPPSYSGHGMSRPHSWAGARAL